MLEIFLARVHKSTEICICFSKKNNIERISTPPQQKHKRRNQTFKIIETFLPKKQQQTLAFFIHKMIETGVP